jgi:ABC-type spermidine/putrescine transport system permease subunit II
MKFTQSLALIAVALLSSASLATATETGVNHHSREKLSTESNGLSCLPIVNPNRCTSL